jgi:hypothetical protein
MAVASLHGEGKREFVAQAKEDGMNTALDTVFASGAFLSFPSCVEGFYKLRERRSSEDVVLDGPIAARLDTPTRRFAGGSIIQVMLVGKRSSLIYRMTWTVLQDAPAAWHYLYNTTVHSIKTCCGPSMNYRSRDMPVTDEVSGRRQ